MSTHSKTHVKNGCQTLSTNPPGRSATVKRGLPVYSITLMSCKNSHIKTMSRTVPLFIAYSQEDQSNKLTGNKGFQQHARGMPAPSKQVVPPWMQARSALQMTESCRAYSTPVQVLGCAGSSRFWRLLQYILNHLFFCI